MPFCTPAEFLDQTDGYSKIWVEPAESISTNELKNELSAMLSSKNCEVSEIVNEARIIADARQNSVPLFRDLHTDIWNRILWSR